MAAVAPIACVQVAINVMVQKLLFLLSSIGIPLLCALIEHRLELDDV